MNALKRYSIVPFIRDQAYDTEPVQSILYYMMHVSIGSVIKTITTFGRLMQEMSEVQTMYINW